MKNKIVSLMLLIAAIFSIPLTITAESRRYTPPAETGYIYIVIKYKGQLARPMKTNVTVNWGGYSHSETIAPPVFALPNNIPEGFVIRLAHKKKDSMAVDVDTDGAIVSVYQGDAPSQSNQKGWSQKNW